MPKIVVLYPPPTDVAAFEKAYLEEHMAIARKHLTHVTGVELLKGVMTPGADRAAFHRVTTLAFATMEDLQRDLMSEGGKATAAHAVQISTGGTPTFIICAEDE